MRQARLSKFLIERIPKGWIDRLYPQGWEEEKDPHPTALDIDILDKGIPTCDNQISKSLKSLKGKDKKLATKLKTKFAPEYI